MCTKLAYLQDYKRLYGKQNIKYFILMVQHQRHNTEFYAANSCGEILSICA